MTIRTSELSSGSHTSTGAETVVMFTVPTGEHVRLRRSTFMRDTGGVTYIPFLQSAAGPGVTLNGGGAGGAGAVGEDAGDHVLEAGDTIRCFLSGAGTVRWWISGTTYTD